MTQNLPHQPRSSEPPDEQFHKELLDNLYDGVYFADLDRRITYWNKGAERLTGYAREEVCGSRCRDNILVHTDLEGRPMCENHCPLTRAMADGQVSEQVAFLQHRAGYRLPVSIRAAPIRDAAGEIVGAVETFSDYSAGLAAAQRISELEALAFVDPLTGLANRRFGEVTLASRLSEFRRHGSRFGILMIDLDRFKSVNDTYGHPAGDEVLKATARTMTASLRPFDFLARWGGEEFLAIVAHASEQTLATVAERTRALVEASRCSFQSTMLRPTISIGGTLVAADDEVPAMVQRADDMLYRSKTEGRNRVSLDYPAPEGLAGAAG